MAEDKALIEKIAKQLFDWDDIPGEYEELEERWKDLFRVNAAKLLSLVKEAGYFQEEAE